MRISNTTPPIRVPLIMLLPVVILKTTFRGLWKNLKMFLSSAPDFIIIGKYAYEFKNEFKSLKRKIVTGSSGQNCMYVVKTERKKKVFPY